MQQNHRSSGSSSSAVTTSGSKEKPVTAPWSKEEEERLLRAALEIAREPVESFDPAISPVERVRQAIGGNFTAMQIVRKTNQLRKRYERLSRREANVGVLGTVLELSDQIWGVRGGDKEKEKQNGREGERNGA